MAEKRRPPGENHIEIYFKERSESSKKLEVLKSELAMKDIKECTFSPKIIRTRSQKDMLIRNSMSAVIPGYENRSVPSEFTFTVATGNMNV